MLVQRESLRRGSGYILIYFYDFTDKLGEKKGGRILELEPF